ncbi:MAG: phosphotransferase family protein [Acidimicrobiales bacterium]
MTIEWLTDVLRDAGTIVDASIESLEGTPVGTGQMADSVRFTLAYTAEEAAAPASVVVKLAAADDTSRATGVALGSYETEVRFYQQVAPTVDISVPRCYFADVDAESGWFTLVLEDLAPAIQGDQLAGCSVDEAALALAQLARLHAPRWGDRGLAELPWLHRNNTPERVKFGAELVAGLVPGFIDRYAAQLDPELIGLSERLMPKIEAWMTDQPQPWTIQHGDYRLDNLLFGGPGSRRPLTVVDWQTAAYGPPLADVSYFVGGGLAEEDRRTNEWDLVHEYHQALVAAGVEGYTRPQCWSDYRRFTLSGLLMAVAASMLVERTPRGDEMFVTMARRHGRHILDLEGEP